MVFDVEDPTTIQTNTRYTEIGYISGGKKGEGKKDAREGVKAGVPLKRPYIEVKLQGGAVRLVQAGQFFEDHDHTHNLLKDLPTSSKKKNGIS